MELEGPAPLRALLIEEDPRDPGGVRRELDHEARNVTLEVATCVEDGIRRLQHEAFDVVLLDLVRPEERALGDLVRILAAAPSVPVLIVTRLDDDRMAFAAIHEGAQDYVVKERPRPDLGRAMMNAIQRKRAEEVLRRRQQEFQALVEHARDVIARFDRDLRIVYVNPAVEHETGLRPDQLVGRTAREFGLMLDPDVWDAAVRTVLATAEEGLVEVAYRSPTGLRQASVRLVPEFAVDGTVDHVLTISRDVTAERAAVAELAVARREIAASEKLVTLGMLVSGVAHEVRTPLTYIQNNLVLIERRGDPEIAHLASQGLDGVQRIARLVSDLRRFTQTRPAERVPANLDEVVKGAAHLFRSTHGKKVELVADLAPVPPLELDRTQVQQLVLNLLENAADASPIGARVHLATRVTPEGAEVVVEDHGAGMTDEVKARLFEPFFTTKPHGTGLGLSIAQRIAEAHRARIVVESLPGKGTRMRVLFTDPRPAASPDRT